MPNDRSVQGIRLDIETLNRRAKEWQSRLHDYMRDAWNASGTEEEIAHRRFALTLAIMATTEETITVLCSVPGNAETLTALRSNIVVVDERKQGEALQ